jgi:hypothetical protein
MYRDEAFLKSRVEKIQEFARKVDALKFAILSSDPSFASLEALGRLVGAAFVNDIVHANQPWLYWALAEEYALKEYQKMA